MLLCNRNTTSRPPAPVQTTIRLRPPFSDEVIDEFLNAIRINVMAVPVTPCSVTGTYPDRLHRDRHHIPINDSIASISQIHPGAMRFGTGAATSVASISISPCDMSLHSSTVTGISPANVSIRPPLLEEICTEILYHCGRSTAGTYALCSRNSALVARNRLYRDVYVGFRSARLFFRTLKEDCQDELGKMVRTLNLASGRENEIHSGADFAAVLSRMVHLRMLHVRCCIDTHELVDSFVGQLEMFTYSFPVHNAMYPAPAGGYIGIRVLLGRAAGMYHNALFPQAAPSGSAL
ncbi:hypothetical protein C8R44DRAFT_873695 [Mycena epipterygia]|nr:hypothetical protein C8R44DRAFT_873695 [Mycena epipterygia]